MSWFSEEDVMRQLQALGYHDVPADVFNDFYHDLMDLAKQENAQPTPAKQQQIQAQPQQQQPQQPQAPQQQSQQPQAPQQQSQQQQQQPQAQAQQAQQPHQPQQQPQHQFKSQYASQAPAAQLKQATATASHTAARTASNPAIRRESSAPLHTRQQPLPSRVAMGQAGAKPSDSQASAATQESVPANYPRPARQHSSQPHTHTHGAGRQIPAVFERLSAPKAASEASVDGRPVRKTMKRDGSVEIQKSEQHADVASQPARIVMPLLHQLGQLEIDKCHDRHAHHEYQWNDDIGPNDEFHFSDSDLDSNALHPLPRGPHIGDSCCNASHEKSVIHQRSPLKIKNKSDPVRLGAAYRDKWQAIKAPGERAHTDVRHGLHDKLRYKEVPVKRQGKPLTVNNYVAPTEKKRLDLRWAVRTHLSHIQ